MRSAPQACLPDGNRLSPERESGAATTVGFPLKA
jgi:hypothetical protein